MRPLSTHDALILAAGRGERLLNYQGLPKPLISFLGLPLLLRIMKTLARAGMKRVVVVVGHQAEQVADAAERYARETGLELQVIHAENWERGNGFSALAARDHFDHPFLMVMCDHVFEPRMLAELSRRNPPEDGLLLAVDRRKNAPAVNMDDVTRVRTRGDRIMDIGKGLESFDCFDVGAFHCTPAVFAALESSGDGTLTGAVRLLARENRAFIWDIGQSFWADLDDRDELEKARKAMLNQAGSKMHDGPVARFINRPISRRLTGWLLNHDISPMQVTWASFGLALLASILIIFPSWISLVLGGVLAQLASITDGCDGEIARLTLRESEGGGWLDAVLDRYADAFLITGFTLHGMWHELLGIEVVAAGLLAMSGTLINSYTADKYDGWMRKQGKKHRFRLGRDVRIMAVMLAAFLDLPLILLWGLALLMHAENVRRMVVVLR
jgi:CDP-L-myo-inositol myo-inositolphosphotransferase